MKKLIGVTLVLSIVFGACNSQEDSFEYETLRLGGQTWIIEPILLDSIGCTSYGDGRTMMEPLYTEAEAKMVAESVPGFRLPTQEEVEILFENESIAMEAFEAFDSPLSGYSRLNIAVKDGRITNRPLVDTKDSGQAYALWTGTVVIESSGTRENVVFGFEVRKRDGSIKPLIDEVATHINYPHIFKVRLIQDESD